MSDPQDERPSSKESKVGEVRRVGRKDRKQRLTPTGPLFPPEESSDTDDSASEEKKPPDVIETHAESSPLPFDTLSKASPSFSPPTNEVIEEDYDDEAEALEEADFQFSPFARPVPSAPTAERFPPLAPDVEPAQKPPFVNKRPPTATKSPRKRRRGNWRHDVIAAIFALATLVTCGFYSWIWQNPYSAQNPFALATPYIEITATPDPDLVRQAIATDRAESLSVALEDVTSEPTNGLLNESTAEITPETTEIVTATPIQIGGTLPFTVNEGNTLYIPNANGVGCNWASIAGIVTGINGEALNGYGVQINDAENPNGIQDRVYSGGALTFGDGGFELVLGGAPVEGRYTVQLFSPAGVPLSDVFFVITSNRCDQNVVVITFEQVREF